MFCYNIPILPPWPGGYLGYRWGVLYTHYSMPPQVNWDYLLPDCASMGGATSCLAHVHMNNHGLEYVCRE